MGSESRTSFSSGKIAASDRLQPRILPEHDACERGYVMYTFACSFNPALIGVIIMMKIEKLAMDTRPHMVLVRSDGEFDRCGGVLVR